MAVLFMFSGGFRVGALPGMKVGDVSKRPSGIAVVRVYRGAPEEYIGMASREAVHAFEFYLDLRLKAGERVGPASPLLRTYWTLDDGTRRIPLRMWNKTKKTALTLPDNPRPIAHTTIKLALYRDWIRAGVRPGPSGGGNGFRHEFKLAHGFRKAFKTNASKGIPIREDVEVLMGHMLNYYKPTPEHLEEEYLKAEPFLTVSEAAMLRMKVAKLEGETAVTIQDLQAKVAELEKFKALLATGAKVGTGDMER